MSNNVTETDSQKAVQLKKEDLLKIKGGIGSLRDAPRETTTEISDNTKSKI